MATIEKRKFKDGTTSFRAKIRIKGTPGESASFGRLTDAKRWVQITEAAIREGRYFGTQESKRHTLADLIDKYELDVLRSSSSDIKNRKRHLAWWKKKIGYQNKKRTS